MKRTTSVLALLLTGALLSGCLYRDVKVPGPLDHATHYQFTTEDFQIVGIVEAEGTIHTVLWAFSWGGAGYSALYEKAKTLSADEIIGYTFEIENYSLITFVYNRATWKARGTAIKYTDKAKPEPEGK